MPFTTATETASPSAAGSATRASRRGGKLHRRTGAGFAREHAHAQASGACGACARKSALDGQFIRGHRHPLFESPQRAAEPRRACGLADSKHSCGARPVELEQDTKRDDSRSAVRARAALPRAGRASRHQTLDELRCRAHSSLRAVAVAILRGTSRSRHRARSCRARCAATRDADRSGASCGRPSRRSPPPSLLRLCGRRVRSTRYPYTASSCSAATSANCGSSAEEATARRARSKPRSRHLIRRRYGGSSHAGSAVR